MTAPTDRPARMVAAARLRAALRLARKRFGPGTAAPKPFSDVMRALLPHMRADNLAGLFIYPGELGGWHCDLVLRAVPPGVANSFGTPVQAPMPTFKEAEAFGVRSLLGVLALERDRAAGVGAAAAPATDPTFDYFDVLVTIPAEAMRQAAEVVRGHPGLAAAPEEVREVLGRLTERLFGAERPTAEAIEALADDDRARLQAYITAAALRGMVRYPGFAPGPPRPPGSWRGPEGLDAARRTAGED